MNMGLQLKQYKNINKTIYWQTDD